MTEHPILFTGEMVRAILAGRKTQTRRIVTSHTSVMGCGRFADVSIADERTYADEGGTALFGPGPYLHAPVTREGLEGEGMMYRVYPRIEPGHRLWVRETWATHWMFDDIKPSELKLPEHGFDAPPGCSVRYRADGATDAALGNVKRWRPSIFMPRWACRLELDVLSVGVERVQLISEADAVAEGIVGTHFAPEPDAAREKFRELWDSINAKRGYSWASNPWVWVVKFKRREEAADA